MARPPMGSRHAQRVDAGEEARERLQWVLAVLGGEASVAEACGALGVGESRFHQLREQALSGAAAALERGRAGRPRKERVVDVAEADALRARVRALEEEVQIERARAALARDLPHLLQRGGRGEKAERSSRRAGLSPRGGGRAKGTQKPGT